MTRQVMPDVTVITKGRARIGPSHWKIKNKAVMVLILMTNLMEENLITTVA